MSLAGNLSGLRERLAPVPVEDRPDLRLVVERRGHSTGTYVAVLVLSILFLVLFGLAVFHTVLIGAQGRLDRLEERIATEEDRQHDLRRQVAELESPARVVGTATSELGMVAPDEVVWLEPPTPGSDAPGSDAPGADAGGSGSAGSDTAGEVAAAAEPDGGGR